MKVKIGSSKVRFWKWMSFINLVRKVCIIRINFIGVIVFI